MGYISSFGTYIKDLLYFTLYIIFIIVLSSLSLLFTPYNLAVKAIVKLFFVASIDKSFGTLDNYFISLESNYLEQPNAIFSLLVTLNGSIDLEQFKTNIAPHFVDSRNFEGKYNYSRLCQFPRKFMGYYFYEWDKNFNINNHITQYNLPVDEASLNDFVAFQSRLQFPKNRPLWNIVIVSNYNHENKTLIYWRIHHTVGDGISIVRLMMSKVFSGENLKSDLDTLCKIRMPEMKPLKNLTGEQLYNKTIGWPRNFINNMKSDSALYEPSTAQQSNIIVCSTKKIPLQSFKLMKQKYGVPMIVALISSISYALQDYLIKYSSINGIESFSLATILPPSREHSDDLMNDFAIGSVKIPISRQSTGSTIWDMTRYIVEEFDKLKVSASPLDLVIPKLINAFPFGILKIFLPKFKGVLVSNMMGPSLSTSVFGVPVEDIQFWIQPTVFPSISFNVLSYNGNVRIGIMGCSNVVKSKDELVELTVNIEKNLSTLFETENKITVGQSCDIK